MAGEMRPEEASVAAGSSSRGEKIAKIGTVVSAIVASSCCWLPLVLIAVGVSGAGIATTLGEYRPYFMVVTFAFLGMAFYFTYRPRPAGAGADGCQADCCPPAATVAEGSKSRFNMMTMNKVMLWGVTILAIAFLFFPKYFTGMLTAEGSEFTDDMTRTTLTVEGMTCDSCELVAAKAIGGVEGVLAVKVDYSTQKATVGTAADQPVPREAILAALEKISYSGEFTLVRGVGKTESASEE